MATRAPDPLAAALDSHAALVTQLDTARTALAARTRRQSLHRTRTAIPSDLLERNRALEQQLAHRLADLDSLRAHSLTKHHAAAAGVLLALATITVRPAHSPPRTRPPHSLDHSHLVASHLASAPSSSPLPALADTLSTRDSRALALLATTSATHSTALDRAHTRRELLRLNRENARLVHELRRKGSLADPARRAHLVAQLDPPVCDYYERLKADLPLSLARVQLLSSVFTRLVAESAVPLSLPAGAHWTAVGLGLSDKEEKALLDDEDEAGWEWTREALVRLLLFAGSEDISSSPAFAGGTGGEEDGKAGDGDGDGEGWEDGQELPREVRERVGRRGREREEEEDGAEVGATNGVAKKGRKRKSAGM
ncbi:uncharacterized protein JCM10292_003641 [Rhodotorula paludigena]|uniref:uncharacterized protein n=1 Tax=Rhodotorula paludigena TaxID=86838 RepID=UPI00316F236B